MSPIRIALVTTLLLLPAARLWAAPQYDYAGQPNELYHAESATKARSRCLWRSPIRTSASPTSFG